MNIDQRRVRRLRKGLERLTRRRGAMPAPQVLVRAPGFTFGFGDLSRPFYSASVGKIVTATLIAMLVERERFALTSPLRSVLPAADLAGLPSAPGVDVAADVTVEHLLTHTSGIPDYFEPPRGAETDCSLTTLGRHRDRLWRAPDLLDEVRRLPAVGRPGEFLHYADSNYVLLARVIEEASGERFADHARARVLEPSGMEHASMPYLPDEPPEDLTGLDAHPFWVAGHELSHARSMSCDLGGGTIVSTAEDLVRFQRALHGGRLVSDNLRAYLLRPRRRLRRGVHYGAGSMTLRFGEILPPLMRGLPEPVGHLGVTATHLAYYPDQDAHVVLNFHSTRQMNASFMTHARIAGILADGKA
ncbi:serine hydrolase [Nocardiopsis sp. MG754419]|uniref:serine hydrolase domain-containing protein n=1 Tax=Nocardiopsis sp. MG754419 TaxID=2259865 RepID=UPI001BAB514B|nr:serine hydrolase domain-containing protein [Nocardiopsis sp. MG754419]